MQTLSPNSMAQDHLPYHTNALLAQTNKNALNSWSSVGATDAVAQESNSLLSVINLNSNLMNLHEQVNGLSGNYLC